jgi:THO complex subunit 2
MNPPLDLEIRSPGFYVTFWQMSTYDLTPVARHTDREVTKINALLKSSTPREKRVEDHLNETRNALVQELKEQIENRTATQDRLSREKAHWFSPGMCHARITRQFAEPISCRYASPSCDSPFR